MRRMLTITSVILLMTTTVMTKHAFAQGESEESSPFFVNMDLVSRYVWRGTDFGNAPQIQPTIKFAKGNFSAGAWGSYSILGNYQEADLFATYSTPMGLSFTVTDYYFPLGPVENTYLSKGHYLETSVGYAKGGFSASGNIMLSTPAETNDIYFELGYTIKNISFFAGAGNEAYTSDGDFMLCNVGTKLTKEIKVTESFSIPVFGSIILNPEKEQVNFVVGMTF